MNAYELAEKLKHWSGNRDELWESAELLCQQAKRIEELEKDLALKTRDRDVSCGFTLAYVTGVKNERL